MSEATTKPLKPRPPRGRFPGLVLAAATLLAIGWWFGHGSRPATPVDRPIPHAATTGRAQDPVATSPLQPDEPAPQTLTTLLTICDPVAASHDLCDSDLYKPVWLRIESSSGEVLKVDVQTLFLTPNGGDFANVYFYHSGDPFDLRNLQHIYFTCTGQFAVSMDGTGALDIPVGSALDAASAAVCASADVKRKAILAQDAQESQSEHERAKHPKPEDYCEGFSREACAEIQTGVDAEQRPAYCISGYGLADSGLSQEQRRICGARFPKDND